jgi:hypothetical protein
MFRRKQAARKGACLFLTSYNSNMTNYLSTGTAILLALGLSAYSSYHNVPKKVTTSYFYLYWGQQDIPDREILAHYVLSNSPTMDPICMGSNECAVEMAFRTGMEPSTLVGQNLTFDSDGFPNGQFPGSGGTFVKNERKP